MKTLLLIVFLAFAFAGSEANADSFQTWICLKNSTNERKLIIVEDVDNYDWDGLSRPDRNWNGTYIEAGKTRCERAEVNAYSQFKYFSFIIPGRDVPHKVRMRNTTDCSAGCAILWRVILATESYKDGILLGAGKRGVYPLDLYPITDQYECKTLVNCSYFIVQDIP